MSRGKGPRKIAREKREGKLTRMFPAFKKLGMDLTQIHAPDVQKNARIILRNPWPDFYATLFLTSPGIRKKYAKRILPVKEWEVAITPCGLREISEKHMPGVLIETFVKPSNKETLVVSTIQRLNFRVGGDNAEDVLKLGNIHWQAFHKTLLWAKKKGFKKVELDPFWRHRNRMRGPEHRMKINIGAKEPVKYQYKKCKGPRDDRLVKSVTSTALGIKYIMRMGYWRVYRELFDAAGTPVKNGKVVFDLTKLDKR